MRFLVSTFWPFLFLTLLVRAVCPPSDQELKPIVNYLEPKFNKAVLGQGIKPDFAADLKWAQDVLFPRLFQVAPPADITKDANKLVEKCHKNANYWTKPAQDAFKKCARAQLPVLLLKYASSGLTACSAFEQDIIPHWDSKYKPKASLYFSQYCEVKGKTC